jgi:hypothetical protein
VPFSRRFIEPRGFHETPPPKTRLTPGRAALRYAYFVKCTNVIKDVSGNERGALRYDPDAGRIRRMTAEGDDSLGVGRPGGGCGGETYDQIRRRFRRKCRGAGLKVNSTKITGSDEHVKVAVAA